MLTRSAGLLFLRMNAAECSTGLYSGGGVLCLGSLLEEITGRSLSGTGSARPTNPRR